MKLFIIAFTFLCCANVFAQSETVRKFKIEKSQFSTSHIQSPLSGTLTVDYEKSLVSMEVERAMPPCPAGELCAQVMPQPFYVELPISNIERDNCGIFHITAEKDLRPTDGDLKKITLEDNSEMTCRTFMRMDPRATYETRYWDRRSGNEVTDVSYMTISRLAAPLQTSQTRPSVETLTMVQGQFLKGYPHFFKPESGVLVLGNEKIQMTIQVAMNCTKGICPRILPQPLYVELPIVKVEKTDCGRVLTALKDERNQNGNLEEIQITDYKGSTCQFFVKPLTEVRFHSLYNAYGNVTEYEANYSFDRK